MQRFGEDDRVRVGISDESDPDFDSWHGRTDEVVDVLENDTGEETTDARDPTLYLVEADDSSRMNFSWRDPQSK